jgi:MSHA biogenesis protein MshM
MYEAHYGLRELPFGLTPDTSFVYPCASFQEALNTLLVAAMNGEGFIKIVGEVGHGKTMLCRTFLARLNETRDQPVEARADGAIWAGPSYVTAFIPNPYLDPRGLMVALAEEFGVQVDRTADLQGLLKMVTLALMKIADQGQQAVACFDEVQAMPQHTLEAVRLLTNIETEKRKLLQVVMFGQPELEVKLRQRMTRQLLQRITFQYTLRGLKRDEVAGYVEHRVKVAGYAGEQLFTRSALRLLHEYSHGTPRLVNILAHKALMLGFGEGVGQIGPKQVKAAAADTPAAYPPRRFFGLALR